MLSWKFLQNRNRQPYLEHLPKAGYTRISFSTFFVACFLFSNEYEMKRKYSYYENVKRTRSIKTIFHLFVTHRRINQRDLIFYKNWCRYKQSQNKTKGHYS